jgi:hypothetical protein
MKLYRNIRVEIETGGERAALVFRTPTPREQIALGKRFADIAAIEDDDTRTAAWIETRLSIAEEYLDAWPGYEVTDREELLGLIDVRHLLAAVDVFLAKKNATARRADWDSPAICGSGGNPPVQE